jgi:hypothetical protein
MFQGLQSSIDDIHAKLQAMHSVAVSANGSVHSANSTPDNPTIDSLSKRLVGVEGQLQHLHQNHQQVLTGQDELKQLLLKALSRIEHREPQALRLDVPENRVGKLTDSVSPSTPRTGVSSPASQRWRSAAAAVSAGDATPRGQPGFERPQGSRPGFERSQPYRSERDMLSECLNPSDDNGEYIDTSEVYTQRRGTRPGTLQI